LYLSFCDVSTIVSCTDVYSSRFGTVRGTSVAVYGTIWFGLATLLAIAGVAGPAGVREHAPGYLFVGSTLALAVVLYLAYASFIVLGVICVLCLVTYAAVAGMFLVTGADSSVSLASLPRHAVSDLRSIASRPVALVLSVVFVAGSVFLLAFFPRHIDGRAVLAPGDPQPDERAQFEQQYAAQPRVSLDVPADGAQVLVVKFNDYQCPPCRETFRLYKDIFAKYEAARPGSVRLVLKDFPLETECNAGVTTNLHPAACEAAVAVRLAREQGTSAALEEWLFANQPELTPELVRQGAQEVGHVKDFDARYAATLDAVRADIADGRKAGVRATPTFVINGVMIPGGIAPHLFDLAIDYELRQAAAK
jgi:protein-disulfide isomerase/uncharacterized membrane protein